MARQLHVHSPQLQAMLQASIAQAELPRLGSPHPPPPSRPRPGRRPGAGNMSVHSLYDLQTFIVPVARSATRGRVDGLGCISRSRAYGAGSARSDAIVEVALGRRACLRVRPSTCSGGMLACRNRFAAFSRHDVTLATMRTALDCLRKAKCPVPSPTLCLSATCKVT